MFPRRALLAAPALLALPAHAQQIAGGRPIRLIVPFPPGGAVDLLGRILAERMQAVLGQNVVVENRGGAGGMIGADAVAKGDKDGSIIGLIGVTTLAAFPFMTQRMPFDPVRDLSPVTQITDGALLCVVNAEAARRHGWTGFRELIRWSRANPERVRMGSSGTGTSSHINIEAINRAANANILHVPYRGGGPAINDLVAGNIEMMFDVMPALMPHVEAGRFLAFAVSSNRPLSILPNIPGMGSFADLGLGSHNVVTWNAIMAPSGVPDATIARLHQAVRQVAAEPAFVQRLAPLGYGTVTSETPAVLAQLIQAERPVWQRLVEVSGARLE
jgi:tripartite-type tricarboxylate transporter receptor subunit TctC